ncbi:MAG: VOC family protein, partial [Actinomycetota bacterium]|nr:VOC family protein [Actinomycetota bacterium]
MGLGIGWLTIDSREPRKLGEFWKEALGLDVAWEDDDGSEYALKGNGWANSYWHVLFYKAPDPKQVKNRLHLDLVPEDQDAEVARLEALGARRVDIGQRDVSWVVMADPEGNEFCILTPRPA